jgi:hypothetical protein
MLLVGTALDGCQGEAIQTDRDLRAGQRYRMDSPGTWEILYSTNPGCRRHRAINEAGLLRKSPPQESERGETGLERRSESISEAAFDAGSRSVFVVPTTLGNAAQANPVEERGTPV